MSRSRLAVVVLVALAALALGGAALASGARGSQDGPGGDARFAMRSLRVDATAAQLTGDERADGRSDRPFKPRWMPVAVLAALFALSALGRRQRRLHGHAGQIDLSWWSPLTARGPPPLRLFIF